ncbi:LysR family transcriptional regulator [Paenibacillus favisporus]|nr:LysR family transcriptional regulator [Paenibacillus favisporus]
MVDFEWYRSFCAIYKHLSLSEAAKSRIMTQPAMSQHLAALEAEVGESLFIRTSRKIVPTERGKELYSRVAPLIESLESTTHDFKSASLPSMAVTKIGTAHEFFKEKILPRLGDFPTCTVTRFGTADVLLDQLKDEQLDIVVTPKKYPIPGIGYTKSMVEEFVIVAPAALDVPEVRNPEEAERWLSAQPWLSYGLELPIIRRIWREHFHKRPLIRPIHVIPNLHMILSAVAGGAGISVVPTYMLTHEPESPGYRILWEELKVSNDIFLAYQLKHKHVPHIQETLSLLQGVV